MTLHFDALRAPLAARLRLDPETLAETEAAALEAACEDAIANTLAAVPADVAARWELDAPPAVVAVVCKATAREYMNPRGAVNESIGGHYLALASDGAAGAALTASELHTLRTLAGTADHGRRAGTTRVRHFAEEVAE